MRRTLGVGALSALAGHAGVLAYVNYSGDFHKSDADFLNAATIVAVGVAAGVMTGGASHAATGSAVMGGIMGAIGGAAAGAAAGGVIGAATRFGGGSINDGFERGAIYGGISGAIAGGAVGYYGTSGAIMNATIDRLTWPALTSKVAMTNYAVFLAKYIANLSCGKGKVYSWSAGGKCVEKPKGGVFVEIFI